MTREEEIIDAILTLGAIPRPGVRKVEAVLGYDITVKERNTAWKVARYAAETPVVINVGNSNHFRRCRAGKCFYKDGRMPHRMRSELTAADLAAISNDPLLNMEA